MAGRYISKRKVGLNPPYHDVSASRRIYVGKTSGTFARWSNIDATGY